MKVKIRSSAIEDLYEGRLLYEKQGKGLESISLILYFRMLIRWYSMVESMQKFSGPLGSLPFRYVNCQQIRCNMAENSSIPINPEVAPVFDSYPKEIKDKMMYLRQLIFDTAATIEGVGEIEETLKWGEPSYLTPQTKSGSTIRIAWKKSQKDQYSMYFKCTANLVPAFKEKYSKRFRFGGNRSIDFNIDDKVPEKELKNCIALALTYHINKKLETTARWEMVENAT